MDIECAKCGRHFSDASLINKHWEDCHNKPAKDIKAFSTKPKTDILAHVIWLKEDKDDIGD